MTGRAVAFAIARRLCYTGRMTELQQMLFSLADEKFKVFNARLIPDLDARRIIGVRTPALRSLAKEIFRGGAFDRDAFLGSLPHEYFEENQLHAFLIEQIKDFDECVARLNDFLPHVDNWATCDQCSPRVFKKNAERLLPVVGGWLAADCDSREFTVRFAIGTLMRFFLDGEFKPEYLRMVADIRSEKYYINMMIAWFFATALAKQWDAAFPFVRDKSALSEWVRRKTVQKACESFRVSDEHKRILRSSLQG